ncbi:unnamed protein product [Caenorhabditis angaria]|uniref:PKD/REJ-like domain-containing protein n=1 Tax=Caenorhabditis angaria TaxID=860376 RepID=A0A9P1J637_9PELO|nr:unnamed protein product [Caenorhabditis angaria]
MKFLLIVILIIFEVSAILINQCYTSGSNCITFQTAQFQYSNSVQINSTSFPYLDGTSDTSSRSKLSELLGQLVLQKNVSIAALVIHAGDNNTIQWKISPNDDSEHPIEVKNSIEFAQNIDNSSVYCFDGSEFTEDPDRILIIPPEYQFFYTKTVSSISCLHSSLVVLPFVWDQLSRSGIRGASYFSYTNCTKDCVSIPISSSLVQLCPVDTKNVPQVKIDILNDFTIEMTDDLLGFTVKRVNKNLSFPMGIVDCSSFMESSNIFGDNAICLGDGENVAIKFGKNPNISVLQEMKTKLSAKSAFIKYSTNSVFPNFTVSHQSEIASCAKTAKFEVKQISGNGFLPLTFEWTVLNGTDDMKNLASKTNDRLLQVPRDYLSSQNTVIVKACNIAGKCTTSDFLITELVDDSFVFSVKIDGYEHETPTSFGLKLHANPNFQRCNDSLLPKDVQYEWQINGESKSTDDGIKLPAFRYGIEEYVNVTLIARYNGEKYYSSNESKTIHYVGLPLLVSLDCVQKQIGLDRDLTIYANANDQNEKNANLEYKWSCVLLNETLNDCEFNKVNWDRSYLYISAAKLKHNQNKSMNFTVNVTSGNSSDSSSCVVTVAPSNLPDVSFYRLAENKQNVNDYIRIQAVVQSSSSMINLTWEVVRDSNYGYFNISSILTNPTTIIENLPSDAQIAVSLTIPPASSEKFEWLGLLTGKTFVIRLWATDQNGASFSDLFLYTNSPPTLGKIDVSYDEPVIALETALKFSVGDGWNDDKEDLPLSYQFGFKTHFENNVTSEFWLTKSTVKSIQFYFSSAGDTTQNLTDACEQRIGHTALLKVCDRLGSCVTGESDIITVEKPSNTTVAVSYLMSLINDDVINANMISAIAKIHSLNQELCTNDFDHSLSDKVMLLLFDSLSQTNESSEYLEAIKAGNLLMPVVSSEILSSVMNVLSEYRKISGHFTSSSGTRAKRAVATATTEESTTLATTTKTYKATESEANDLLKVYDILIVKDKPVIDVYFLNINDFLTGFCVQLDESSDRIMSANGSGYTSIQRVSELNSNRSVSDLYQISLIDPVSGTLVTISNGQILYTVDILVTNYKPIYYYDCVIFNQHVGWDATLCESSEYAFTKHSNTFIRCNCSSPGIIGVFNVNAPTPDPLPDHNEISITMVIDVDVSSDDLAKLFIRIAQLSEVDVSRFVKISNKGNRTISATLRPPYKVGQKSNSYSIQAIARTIRYQKLLNVITVTSFSYQVVTRNLTGDSNARKITMSLYRSYLSQLGTDSDDIAKKWTQSIATAFQISEYRFKNAKIFFGIVFNFTITVAMSDEVQPLTADEIALMIQECSKYGELDFTISDEIVQVSQLQDNEIIKLVVITETNALMLALVIVLSAVLGFGTLLIGGAVIIKLKTDKLIEEERRRAILNEQFHHPPPEYGNSENSYNSEYTHRRVRQQNY